MGDRAHHEVVGLAQKVKPGARHAGSPRLDAPDRGIEDDAPRCSVAGSLSSAISGRTRVTMSDAMRPQQSVQPTKASPAEVTGVRVVCHGSRTLACGSVIFSVESP